MIQSNWICKSIIVIIKNDGAVVKTDRIEKGHLRCVRSQNFRGGAASRDVRYRIPALKIPALSYSIAVGGINDWISIWSDGAMGRETFFYCDLKAEDAIEVQTLGAADNHAVQLSFWYEPEDPEDDSHLAPLSVGRGGIPT